MTGAVIHVQPAPERAWGSEGGSSYSQPVWGRLNPRGTDARPESLDSPERVLFVKKKCKTSSPREHRGVDILEGAVSLSPLTPSQLHPVLPVGHHRMIHSVSKSPGLSEANVLEKLFRQLRLKPMRSGRTRPKEHWTGSLEAQGQVLAQPQAYLDLGPVTFPAGTHSLL